MAVVTRGIEEFNAAVKADPHLLDNQTIQRKALNGGKDDCSDGVRLENMVIRNLTLRDVQMWRAHFKNVTFVDCTFVKADFRYSIFDNVKFIRGSLSGFDEPDDQSDWQTDFQGTSITRVLFDGVHFGPSVSMSFYDGIVSMRNIEAELPPKKNYWLLSGTNIQVRMDNCRVANQAALLGLGENSSLYATNSVFINAELKLPGKAAWIENCTWSAGVAPDTNTLVIINSRLSGIVIGAGTGSDGKEDGVRRVFLVNNTYTQPQAQSNPPHVEAASTPPQAPDNPPHVEATLILLLAFNNTIRDNSHLYLYAGSTIPGRLVADSGNINIYNTAIDSLRMGQGAFNCSLAKLNLQNIKIGQGNWEDADMRQGKWENVLLGKPIDLNQAKIGPIIGHRVDFTHGYPWINGKLEIIDSSKPLEFDKPPVPTLEELGLAQFWKEHDFPVEQY
jgi:uncharacterized protein YjbI with pentapeptide repeats